MFDDVIPLRKPSNNDAYHAMIEQAYADKDDLFLEEEDGHLSKHSRRKVPEDGQ